MKVLIIGGAGMIGRKLATRLATDARIAGELIEQLTLFDMVPAAGYDTASVPVTVQTGDMRSMETVEQLGTADWRRVFAQQKRGLHVGPFAKSLARQLGTQTGRAVVRGVLGGLFRGR